MTKIKKATSIKNEKASKSLNVEDEEPIIGNDREEEIDNIFLDEDIVVDTIPDVAIDDSTDDELIDIPEISTVTEDIPNIASDIKVVKCVNCKEDVLEADLCPICGKPLKKKTKVKRNTDLLDTERDTLHDNDFFEEEDEYISNITSKLKDEESYEG